MIHLSFTISFAICIFCNQIINGSAPILTHLLQLLEIVKLPDLAYRYLVVVALAEVLKRVPSHEVVDAVVVNPSPIHLAHQSDRLVKRVLVRLLGGAGGLGGAAAAGCVLWLVVPVKVLVQLGRDDVIFE